MNLNRLYYQQNLPHWQSTQRWLIEPFLSSRWVPLSRWHQTRRTTASSWTSQDPAALHPSLGTWAQAWMHPTWAGPRWEWASQGAKAWGLSAPTAKECPSKVMQDPGLRAWVCRVWKDRTQERWGDINSTLSPSSFSFFSVNWIYVCRHCIHSQTMVGSSMDQITSSLTSRGSTPHPTLLGHCRPRTTLDRGCQDSSCRASTRHRAVPWASTIRCSNPSVWWSWWWFDDQEVSYQQKKRLQFECGVSSFFVQTRA